MAPPRARGSPSIRYDRFNAGDVDGAAEQYAEDCEWDFPAFGTVCRTRQEVRDVCRDWKAAFPDGRVEVTNAIACGDMVVVEWDSHGTWTGHSARPPANRMAS